MNSLNFPRRLEAARADAKERQAARDGRSNEEQLRVLDLRLGNGVGATRERARLQASKVTKQAEKPVVEAVSDISARPRDRKGAGRKA